MTIDGIRSRDDTSRFERIDVHFRLVGPSQEQAVALVERWKER